MFLFLFSNFLEITMRKGRRRFKTHMRKATNAKRFRRRCNFNDFIRVIALISSSLFLSATYLQPLYLQNQTLIPFTIFWKETITKTDTKTNGVLILFRHRRDLMQLLPFSEIGLSNTQPENFIRKREKTGL